MPNWLKSRTVVLGTAAVILVIVAIVVFVYAFTSGPSAGGAGPATASDVVLSVDQALAAEQGQKLNVAGAILSTGGKMVLASALAESNPPQASGSSLPLAGLSLGNLVGLSTTAGQAGATQATWSDFQLVLQGIIKGGVLQVSGTPPVEEDTSIDGVRLRFSPVSVPISSGDQVTWTFDVTNTSSASIDIVFSDGQKGDVVLSQGDVDKYTWSSGKAFTQTVETVTIQPGRSYPIVLSGDTLDLPAGDYDVAATVTGMVGPAGQESPPPDIMTTITIR
jgi:hypothetical protein